MAIRSEVFGSCVGEINVSVELKNGDAWLCCGWKYMRFILEGGAAQDRQWRRRWCQVLDAVFEASGDVLDK